MLLFSRCASFQAWVIPDRPAIAATADGELQAKIQAILDDAVNEFRLPGAQAGLRLPDGRVILAASGTADYGRKQAAITGATMFRIGSATKMFVAALVCRQAERGQLSLDDAAARWFPGQDWARDVTVRALLQQVSGIPETLFTDPGILVQSMFNPAKLWDPAAVARTLMDKRRLPPPEQRGFRYSNNNYVLLGVIAEKVGGRSLAAQLAAEFFVPLGMKSTCLLPYDPSVAVNLAAGVDEYLPFGPMVLDARVTAWDSLTFGAGAMASTALDQLLWLDALFHGRVVSPASLELMRAWVDTPGNGRDEDITGYGLGLARYELGGRLLEGHPGGGFGGECFPFWWPDRDVSVVVSYNLSRKGNPAGKAVLGRILDLL